MPLARRSEGGWMVGGPETTLAPRAVRRSAMPLDGAEQAHDGEVLGLEGVSVRFGGISALVRREPPVSEGVVLGLIGPNGAGKTTLFDVISGMRTPNEGRVRFAGSDIHAFVGGRAVAPRPAPHLPAGPDVRVALGRGQRAGRARVARRRWRHARRPRRLPDPSRAASEARRERVAEVLEQCGLTAVRAGSGRFPAHRSRAHGRVRRAIVDEPKLAAARRADLRASTSAKRSG